MAAHRQPEEPGDRGKPWNLRRLIPVAAVLCLVAAAFGGVAMADGQHGNTPLTVNLAGASGANGRTVTVYACVASGKLTRISVAAAPTCPSQPAPVHRAGQSSPTSSPRPRPHPTLSAHPSTSAPTVTASTPTAAPTPSGSGTRCVTAADRGQCGPYTYAGITGSGGGSTFVIQDVWNPVSGASQTLTAYNPGQWSVSADMPAGRTGVVSYPDVQQIYTTTSDTPDPLSSFHSLTSSFTESGPGSSGGNDYEAAYDIWAGTGNHNGAQEIMIWVDNHGQTPAGSKVATADIGGTSYSVWSAGKNPVSLVLNTNETSGTINILAALDWLMSNGYMPAGSGVNQIDFGWEICSTGGTAKTFSLTQFGITSS
jgi:Glycosyl hydrolase family 12